MEANPRRVLLEENVREIIQMEFQSRYPQGGEHNNYRDHLLSLLGECSLYGILSAMWRYFQAHPENEYQTDEEEEDMEPGGVFG